jgi:hypothetical protein
MSIWLNTLFTKLFPLAVGAAAVVPPAARAATAEPPVVGGGVINVAVDKLVATADLHINGPASRSEAGLPLGNGRMGTLVWTTPAAVHMQINRVDVFASNKDTASFPERHTDYCGGCAQVAFDVGGETFTDAMTQSLSCYDGVATVDGAGVRIRAYAAMDVDVIVLEIADERPQPQPMRVTLGMLRPAIQRRFAHEAVSHFEPAGAGGLVLTQKFQEGDYYCGSAVAVQVSGRVARLEQSSENDPDRAQELTLAVEASNQPFTIRVASAASFDRTAPIGAIANMIPASAEAAQAFNANQAWWGDFWNRGFVWLHSDDGAADTVMQHYIYWLYLMASTSRGDYPTKFNGMLWTTGGDRRQWGAQYWGANQECLYNGLFPANRMELLDPMFHMVTGMADSCAVAAREQWGSRGIFLPETHAFDGLAALPAPIAAEMRELYLVHKPMRDASPEFLEFARLRQPHSSRWNWWESGRWVGDQWRPQQRPEAPFGAVTHIFSRGGKYAYAFWQRYEFTRDEAWLRNRAYPILRGVAEFYRNFPNTRRGDDGTWHIHHVNSNESVRDASDTDEEIAAMRGVLAALIRASEILQVDADMRPVWQEFLDNLAPLPISRGRDGESPVWTRAAAPAGETERRRRGYGRPDGNTMPQWFFDLCTLENPDAETMRIANATLDGYGRGGGVLSKVGVANAMMGRAEAVREFLPRQLAAPDRAPVMENRMDQREGPQTTSAQRLGRVADALHNAMLQSVGPGPATEPVIRVFPATPREWDAAFTLLARGGFLVTSSQRGGRVQFIAIQSPLGGVCRVRNPWPESAVTLLRSVRAAQDLRGSLLEFETQPGERITILPAGARVEEVRSALP